MTTFSDIDYIECSACGTRLSGKLVIRSNKWGVGVFVNPCKKCCGAVTTSIINETEAPTTSAEIIMEK